LDEMVWIRLIWLRIGTSGGLFWTRRWTSGFHKMLGISWGAAKLTGSEGRLGSMSEWVNLCKGRSVSVQLFSRAYRMNWSSFYCDAVMRWVHTTTIVSWTLHQSPINREAGRQDGVVLNDVLCWEARCEESPSLLSI
jgi:hypothetical protein